MRIEYQKKSIDTFKEKIEASQKASFAVAVAIAFISVFAWFFKILLF